MESHFSSKIESVCKVYIQQHNHLPRNQQKNHNKVVVRVGEKIHPHKLQWFMLSLPLWPPVLLGLFSTQQKQLNRDDLEKSLQIQDHWLHNLHLLFEMTLLLLLAGIYIYIVSIYKQRLFTKSIRSRQWWLTFSCF